MRAAPSKILTVALLVQAVMGVICVGVLVFGIASAYERFSEAMFISGAVGIVVIASAVPMTLAIRESIVRTQNQSAGAHAGSIDRVLADLHQNSMLSDTAKRVLFRDQELSLLRRAIEEDIASADYNAGLTLCDDMANLFGRREEAEAFRTRILEAGHAALEARITQSIRHFDQILSTRDWASAHREAASIKRLYPGHHLVDQLDQRILAAREEHKRQLEAQFMDAAGRDDVDAAMLLLRELDRYLSPEEAAGLATTAQRVVSRHRENLSSQFKQAVNDHRWAEAASIGDIISREYPNTKMADEVRAMIDVIRVRATQASVMTPR